MPSRIITANSLRFHILEEGEGPLMVMLHGFPDFSYTWRYQIPALSVAYKVVAPDLRGYHLSDKPPRVNDYNIQHLVEDVVQIIRAAGAENACVIGHDWGGVIAWALASLRPEIVNKLVIINAPHPDGMRNALLRGNLRQWLRSWYIFFFQIPWLPEQVIGSHRFFEKVFLKEYANPSTLRAEDIPPYVHAYERADTRRATVNYYRAAFRQIFAGRVYYPPVKAPVLVLWGERDRALGKELTYPMPGYCENSCKIIYEPESGHFLHHDKPDWVNRHILDFVNDTK
ncbi:MAG: alpha/beta hydrolase [Chitinophagales bacterium]|nr:alpha/beta hydrolase [Chitinophagales bacterium]